MTTTDTPRPDACPHCGCQTKDPFGMGETIHNVELCFQREARQKAEAEVERLRAFIANELQNKNSDLRDNLRRVIEFAERYTTCRPDCPADYDGPNHCTCGYQRGIEEVWALRTTLNPANK